LATGGRLCVTGQHTDGIFTGPICSGERIAGLRERTVAG
jgi:hypothetical protein